MYLLYLDESGGATEIDQDYYVLAGISAHERKPFFLGRELDDLQKRWFPTSTEAIEFHASHIRNGKGEPWISMTKPERLKLMNEMCSILAKAPDSVSLFGVAMHKPSLPHFEPIGKTCEEIAGHFDAMLTRLEARDNKPEKQRGLMIFDQTAHQKTLHSLLAEYRTSGASWGKVKHLAEIPMFTDSKLTRMLQWADFVAYAVFRRYQHADSSFFDRIVSKFDHAGGILHGLVHLIATYQDCFCPACVTRRSAPRVIVAGSPIASA